MNLSEKIKAKGREIGFSRIGITDTSSLSEKNERRYREWLAGGYNAEMEFLKKDVDKRLHPAMLFEGARTIIVVAINYSPGAIELQSGKDYSVISRYALGYDYHTIIADKLVLLLDYIRSEVGGRVSGKIYCDSGSLMEKTVAERAGLGWIGKNSLLITKEFGSWVFLGEIVLDIELEGDNKSKNLCSDCNLCIQSCPTGAIIAPGKIDASRCISYLTVENKGAIPEKLRYALGNRVFGCDSCQEVCPFNSNVTQTKEPLFEPDRKLIAVPLDKLFFLASNQFSDWFRDSTIKRVKRNGLLRNIVVAIGNSENKKFVPLLKGMCEKANAVLQEHAEWAISRVVS